MKRLIVLSLVFFAMACGGDDNNNDGTNNGDGNNSDKCVTTKDHYKTKVQPIFSSKCTSCHAGPSGIGYTGSEFKINKDDLGDADSVASVKAVIAKTEGGQSLFLLKATNETAHTGGPQIQKDSDEYKVLEELVNRVNTPKECDADMPF